MSELEETPASARVLAALARCDAAAMPTKARAIALACGAMGWQSRGWHSVLEVAPVLFLADSEEGAANPHAAGDARFPGYEQRRYWLEARHPQARLGFRALWTGRGEGSTASFEYARIADPLGIPVENYVDYTVEKIQAKEWGWSEAERVKRGAEVNARINDGTSRMEKFFVFDKATEFLVWLDDWIMQLAPDHKTLAPAPRMKKTVDEQLLSGEDWNG